MRSDSDSSVGFELAARLDGNITGIEAKDEADDDELVDANDIDGEVS